jgi:fermentation-respiration switch protein FrsA (DUF1100 family)
MSGMKSSEVRPAKSAARLGNRPLFVIHGTNDDLTDPASAGKIYAAAQGPKELWMVPDCGHGQGPVVSPEEYKAVTCPHANRNCARCIMRRESRLTGAHFICPPTLSPAKARQ